MMIDRPYQQSAVNQVLDYAAAHPTGSVLLVIPTRGGKTHVGAKLVLRMAVRHGLRTLWIAHREELLDAAVEHLIQVGIHPASIGMIKARRSERVTGSPLTSARVLTPKELCSAVCLKRRLRTFFGAAPRPNSMTMRIPLRSDSSRT